MKTNHYLDRQLSEIMEKAFFFLIDKKHAEISNTELLADGSPIFS